MSMKDIKGLSTKEVEKRVNEDKINKDVEVKTKTISQIITSNVFTYLNFIILGLVILLIIMGSYVNTFFFATALFNTAINILQEIQIKKKIDKLTVLNVTKALVLRANKEFFIPTSELVLDDVVIVKEGNQICADSIVLKSIGLVVNESLITGESNSIQKEKDDTLLSGSYVTSGSAYIKVTHVGKDNYSSRLMIETKQYKKVESEIIKNLNKLIKIFGMLIIPFGLTLFLTRHFLNEIPLYEAAISSIGGVVGMIPQGLIVLSTISFALGVIKMSKYNAYLKSLPSIETFSRVNVMCIDKTGTLTEGDPVVTDVIEVGKTSMKKIEEVLSNMNRALPSGNPTSISLLNKFGKSSTMKEKNIMPFSSENKISAVTFNEGTWVLGAYEFMNEKETSEVKKYLTEGYRIVTLGFTKKELSKNINKDIEIKAYILMLDKIKSDAKEIINYLQKENITIKVISGDNPISTSNIAKRCNINAADKYIDMSKTRMGFDELIKEYTVFGRTSPYQKRELIRAYKRNKDTVSMMGDGVNDILALKDADFSIAMGNGSDACKNISEVVLMDSNFSSLPHIMVEGRKIINNINNLASLYLAKTIYSALLVLLFIFLPFPYPFEPVHLTLLSTLTIGMPSAFFILFQQEKIVTGNFLRNIFLKALPFSLAVVICIVLNTIFGNIYNINSGIINALNLINTFLINITLVSLISNPVTKEKSIMLYFIMTVFLLSLFLFRNLLNISLDISIFSLASLLVAVFLSYITLRIQDKFSE